MQLPLTPFTPFERKKKYILNCFTEQEKPFAFLRDASVKKITTGNKYKFGCVSEEGEYFWFFNKKVVCNSRSKALEIYTALLSYCEKQKIGKPFTFKA